MRRVRQPNDWYCGPATLEMLLSFQNHTVSQDLIVELAGVGDRIKRHGMLLTDFVLAMDQFAPDLGFWYKRDATISELSSLVNKCGYPVGVEWQGIFDCDDEDEEDEGDDEDEDEDEDDDPGHYSVVTGISTMDNWITLADPYHNNGVDRQYTLLEFERRWWDINEQRNKKTGRWQEIDDYHAMFIVTAKDDGVPELFNMVNE